MVLNNSDFSEYVAFPVPPCGYRIYLTDRIKQSFFIYLGNTIFGAWLLPLRRVTLSNPCNIHRSLYYNNCHINMYELNFEDHTATFKLSSFCPQHIKNAWAQRPSCCIRRNSTRSRGPHPSLSSLVNTGCIKVIMCTFLLLLKRYRGRNPPKVFICIFFIYLESVSLF